MESVNTFSYRNYLKKVKVYLEKVKLYIKNNYKSELIPSSMVDVMNVGFSYEDDKNFDVFVQSLINNTILVEEMAYLENIIKMDSAQIKIWNEEFQKRFELRQEKQMALLRSDDRTIVN